MPIEGELPFDSKILENKQGYLGWYKDGPNKKLIRAHGTMWIESTLTLGNQIPDIVWIRQKDPVKISDLIDNLNGIVNDL